MIDITDMKKGAMLAPMAGVSDRVFRRVCRAFGAASCVTPMVSAKSLLYKNAEALELAEIDDGERNTALQLFGQDARDIAGSLSLLDLSRYRWIDINMGCPAPKITRQGAGGALMRDIPRASDIISSVKKASPIPVSVKFRAGFDGDHINCVEFARMAEESGADMLTLHPRTVDQQYSGRADRSLIERVVKSVSIPVVGNGDVKSGEDALSMLRDTGCAIVMIGRGCFGSPWIFSEVAESMGYGSAFVPTDRDRIATALAHAEMLVEALPERVAILQMRKHIAWYVKGMPGASEARQRVNLALTLDELKEILLGFAENSLDIARDEMDLAARGRYISIMNASGSGAVDKA